MIAIVKLEISNGRAAKENCSSSVFYLLSFTCLPTSLLIQRPPGAIVFSCCVLTDSDMASSRWSLRGRYLSLREERYRRKTRQRAPKPPFGFWLLYGGLEGRRAYVLRVRRNAIDAIKSAAVPRSKYPWGALRLFPCLCVLRPDGGASASPEEVPLGCAAQKE